MDTTIFPTKGNLLAAENTLRLSRQGYELMDKKRSILVREMMEHIERAKAIQAQIDETFKNAYDALRTANILQGIAHTRQIGEDIGVEESVEIDFRSVMGVELPKITLEEEPNSLHYGLASTTEAIDLAYLAFKKVKSLITRLAEVENSVYRLAVNINKTRKRANALKNIIIPRGEALTAHIRSVLEEKDREEFSRLKAIKKQLTMDN